MRRIIVCADDAGWSEANDAVIVGHAMNGDISAVSVLVDGPTAGDWAAAPLPSECALGLHLNLTWSAEDGSRGLTRLILDAFSGRLNRHSMAELLATQIARFERLLSRPPDFVDGHQHVQILPVVRDTLLNILEHRYSAGTRPPVRVPYSPVYRGLKCGLLNSLGAKRLATDIRALGWPANRDFAGAYDLTTRQDYRRQMRTWLSTIQDGGLIMAHPGSNEVREHGPARTAESEYFGGPHWRNDLEEADIGLIPFTSESLLGVVTE